MKSVLVRNVKIGEGLPKVCVPILGESKEQILDSARAIKELDIDLVEWRADWFEFVFDYKKVTEVLMELRDILGDLPLLFTFRTLAEGGNRDISNEDYMALNKKACDSGKIDMLDVQMFTGEALVQELISYAHANDIIVVGSNHDFNGTPSKKQIVTRLQLMQHFEADIVKIAVMPKTRTDVFTLITATEEMVSKYAKVPVVAMSMSKLGVISRVAGELFGSCITFAAAGQASAPGQIAAKDMKRMLETLSCN